MVAETVDWVNDIKLSEQLKWNLNKTETKQFENSFETV